MSRIYNILQPDYYSRFKCDPGMCLESCCERWKITIDRKTYNEYMESSNAKIKEIVGEGLSVNENSESSDDFGVLNLRSDMTCPFLNVDKYCDVFINLGGLSFKNLQKLSKGCCSNRG